MSFLIGVGVLILVWFAIKTFATTNPHLIVGLARKLGGVAALAAAALLLLRGRVDMALGLGYLGLWLFGYGSFGVANLWQRTTRSKGTTSRVRSAMIEMELDHETGAMRGRVLAGEAEGRELDAIGRDELLALLVRCAASDAEGARLLEAYLDRRFPTWREDAQTHADAGPRRQAQSGAMTEQEAYEVLGLQPGAGSEDIRRAHRALMKKLHPDQGGGSTYLAARVNQAKDILLGRHR
jgi:DnaJ-domain-containing protein 1